MGAIRGGEAAPSATRAAIARGLSLVNDGNMRRIAVIGCGGSGKSTLARRMGARLDIPVHHLDRWYWKAGWIRRANDEWAVVHGGLCSGSRWILDGNHGGTMNARFRAADTVIFPDLPRWRCLWGAFRRYWMYRGQARPELSRGCPERLNGEYLKWIWTFRRVRRPRILRTLELLGPDKKVLILDSYNAIAGFLDELGEGPDDAPLPRTAGRKGCPAVPG